MTVKKLLDGIGWENAHLDGAGVRFTPQTEAQKAFYEKHAEGFEWEADDIRRKLRELAFKARKAAEKAARQQATESYKSGAVLVEGLGTTMLKGKNYHYRVEAPFGEITRTSHRQYTHVVAWVKEDKVREVSFCGSLELAKARANAQPTYGVNVGLDRFIYAL